jgi:uridine kinase
LLPDLCAAILARDPPAGVATRIVAVDGHGGAGKTTFSAALAAALGAHELHTDDFAGWDLPDWPERLLAEALEPLARGVAATFVASTWGGVPERPPITVPAGGTVVLEGCSAARALFRPYLAYAIWIETPRDLCLERGLARDGEQMRVHWERWLADEDAYIERERPQDYVDRIVHGSS